MTAFATARDAVRAARDDREAADARFSAARDELSAALSAQAGFERTADPHDPSAGHVRDELARRVAAAEDAVGSARAQARRALDAAAAAVEGFVEFADPRAGIEQLDDAVPILLLPVRLETRFFRAAPGEGPVDQLRVRIYPDDIGVDGFDPRLTATEIEDARTYWTEIWKAGGIEDQERGAWGSLVRAHGSGRAAWIVESHVPGNPADRPSKAAPEDVVLAIVLSAPLAPAETTAILAFWPAVWRSAGDPARIATARGALAAAVGAARAGALEAGTAPANLADPLPTGIDPADVDVSAAVLVLPDAGSTPTAWSTPPMAGLLPDRFLFIGYRTAGDPDPVIVAGAPVRGPLQIGPDPSATGDDQLRHEPDGSLHVPDELAWMVDYDAAVKAGMGITVDLTGAVGGFARVLVVGLRLSADADVAATELETLLTHHARRRTGLSVLAQGTPTNNTRLSSADVVPDDPDASFDALRAPQFTPTAEWRDKRDGQWLAEWLGVDSTLFVHTRGAGGRDQLASRAMNDALWPATLGYWMESMMAPVFDDDAVDATRDFFRSFVVPGGVVPSIRIGDQPYGILPATAFSRMDWFPRHRDPKGAVAGRGAYLRRLHGVLTAVQQDFAGFAAAAPHVGAAGDPHATLLDIVGLHPGSVEWSQRYAESLKTLFNRLNLVGLGGFAMTLRTLLQRAAAAARLRQLAETIEEDPPILDLSFSGRHNVLRGGVVDDRPLSETDGIRAYTPAGDDYLTWLVDAASTSLNALYRQDGFSDGKSPTALLYLLLRHALQLAYSDAGIRLRLDAGVYTQAQARIARADEPILHVGRAASVSESRYAPLFASEPAITAGAAIPVHEFIAGSIGGFGATRELDDVLAGVRRLQGLPTAQLERAFADSVDAVSYRLDAWLLGLVNVQLAGMRRLTGESDREGDGEGARGIHLGCYAWLEPLRPEPRRLRPVDLSADPQLAADFASGPPLVADSANQGFVHAPSVNHAVAAAVLRNGYLSDATAQNRRTLAVNLTSERVRLALSFIEGIRGGQSLGALLGYRFERGLHDAHGLAEVDSFIFELRGAFPLRAGRFVETKPPEGTSIMAVEARNVLDGLALVEHIAASGSASYPFGLTGLPDATAAQRVAIDAEVDRLREAHDAVADLALSEGVYQAVLGNYDRVASTYDAYARGDFPPEPAIARTQLPGVGLTHRVAVHLDSGASPALSPVPGIPMTPRAQAEPGVNAWLAAVLPRPDRIGCTVTYRSAASAATVTQNLTLADLRLQPADLVVLIRDDADQAMRELDDRILRHARTVFDPRPDAPIVIGYLDRAGADLSVFEAMPLVRALRSLVTRSRPVTVNDLRLANEASRADESTAIVDVARIDAARNGMGALRSDLDLFLAPIDALLADADANRVAIIAAVDGWTEDFATLAARAAAFGVAQAGWGFAYDTQRQIFARLLALCAETVERWSERLARSDAQRAASAAAADEEARLALLGEAEALLTTAPLTPRPASVPFRLHIEGTVRPAFMLKDQELRGVATTAHRTAAALLGDVQGILPLSDFDATPVETVDIEDAFVAAAQDLHSATTAIVAELDRRIAATKEHRDAHDATIDPAARLAAASAAAKALLGDDFRVFPAFTLTPAEQNELLNADAASVAGSLFAHLTAPADPAQEPIDFPVDEWLYGVARVREKLAAWEQTVMLSGAFGRPEPGLRAIQLPHRPGDGWLALRLAPDAALDTDRLLYTAHHATPFDPSRPQCGLLVDEWTEMIPGAEVDTGLAFHFDRPDNEAPQSLLLMTPTAFHGRWRWDDLADGLNETLDLAKLRAVEPDDIDRSAYAPFLPATVVATQVRQLTIAAELAINNAIALSIGGG